MKLPKLDILFNTDFMSYCIASNEDAAHDGLISESLNMSLEEYQNKMTSKFNGYLEHEEGFGLQVFFKREYDAEKALKYINTIIKSYEINMQEKVKKSMENNAPQQTFYIPLSIEVIGKVTKSEVERLVFEAIQDQYLKGFNFNDENAVAIGLSIMAPNPAKKAFS